MAIGGELTVGIGGFGAIGEVVARALDNGIAGLKLIAVSARDQEAAADRMAGMKSPPPVTNALRSTTCFPQIASCRNCLFPLPFLPLSLPLPFSGVSLC